MSIGSDIERLLTGSVDLPTAEQVLRAELCLESRQLDHAEALFSFIKVRSPDDFHAYIGLGRTLAEKRRFEEALLELADARRIIAAGPVTDQGMDDFLFAYSAYHELEQKKGAGPTEARRLIIDGLKLRAEGSHEEAEKIFRGAIQKAGSPEEADEARFYIVTLHRLPPTVIEQRLRGLKMPKFFSRFSEVEKDYLRRQFVRLSDKYLPWETDEDLVKFHVKHRQPLSSKDAEALKNIKYIEDLGI